MAKLRVAVLVSGRGSNLQALLEACRSEDVPAEIALVIANKPDALALQRAREAGVESLVIDHRDYETRALFDGAMHKALETARIDFVCLAGFMRLFTAQFTELWGNRMLNIHPSLLPLFPGLGTHARAIAAGVKFAGCTVHFVRFEVDTGPILVQAVVPVHPEDSADTLAARVLQAEHRAYPFALRLVAEGRVRVEGERAIVQGAETPATFLMNPR